MRDRRAYSPTARAADAPDPSRVLVIGCGALARELVAVIDQAGLHNVDLTCLPATLHNRPGGIPAAVRAKVRAARQRYQRIFIAYADCGTGGALDRVLVEEGVERLPGAHCYEVFAGSPAFAEMMDEEPGTFFLTDFLARNFDRLVWVGLGLDRHPELLPVYFGAYKRVVYLAQSDDPRLVVAARRAARRLGLAFEMRRTGYGDLGSALVRAASAPKGLDAADALDAFAAYAGGRTARAAAPIARAAAPIARAAAPIARAAGPGPILFAARANKSNLGPRPRPLGTESLQPQQRIARARPERASSLLREQGRRARPTTTSSCLHPRQTQSQDLHEPQRSAPSPTTRLAGPSPTTRLAGPSRTLPPAGLSPTTPLAGPSPTTPLAGPLPTTSLAGLSPTTRLAGPSRTLPPAGLSPKTRLAGPSPTTPLAGPPRTTPAMLVPTSPTATRGAT